MHLLSDHTVKYISNGSHEIEIMLPLSVPIFGGMTLNLAEKIGNLVPPTSLTKMSPKEIREFYSVEMEHQFFLQALEESQKKQTQLLVL